MWRLFSVTSTCNQTQRIKPGHIWWEWTPAGSIRLVELDSMLLWAHFSTTRTVWVVWANAVARYYEWRYWNVLDSLRVWKCGLETRVSESSKLLGASNMFLVSPTPFICLHREWTAVGIFCKHRLLTDSPLWNPSIVLSARGGVATETGMASFSGDQGAKTMTIAFIGSQLQGSLRTRYISSVVSSQKVSDGPLIN